MHAYRFEADAASLIVTSVSAAGAGPCAAAAAFAANRRIRRVGPVPSAGHTDVDAEAEEIETYEQLESILRTAVPGIPLRFVLDDADGTAHTADVAPWILGKTRFEMAELLAAGAVLRSAYPPRAEYQRRRLLARLSRSEGSATAPPPAVGLGFSSMSGGIPGPMVDSAAPPRAASDQGIARASSGAAGETAVEQCSAAEAPSDSVERGVPQAARSIREVFMADEHSVEEAAQARTHSQIRTRTHTHTHTHTHAHTRTHTHTHETDVR